MPFLAQTPAPLAPDLPRSKSILETLIAAGPVMYVLLAMSIVLVMLVVTYLLTIRRGTVVSSGFMATADAKVVKFTGATTAVGATCPICQAAVEPDASALGRGRAVARVGRERRPTHRVAERDENVKAP